MKILNFIGGEFVTSTSPKTIEKLSPFSAELLAETTSSEAFDVIKALQAAKKAAPLLRELSFETRAQVLLDLARHLEQNAEEIAYAEALHQGLSLDFSLENNVQVAIKILKEIAADLISGRTKKETVQADGVIGIITTWGLSLRLVLERWAPAFAAGNAVLIKISEHSPITGQILGEAFSKINLLPGSANILHGDSEVGALIAGHPGIRAISAVGKTSTMESIAKAGVSHFKKLQLSGSAKNPAIVLGDSGFETRIEEILRPFLMGQGQLCWNTSRIFVLESFAPAFIQAVKEYFDKLAPMKDPRDQSLWTPMISESAGQNILTHVQAGKDERGKILSGGEAAATRGFFIRPTVMLDLSNCSVLQQDDLQGPLLLITAVKYQHEAVKWANTSYLAHSGIVWGPSEKVFKVAGQLEVAHVWINSWMSGDTSAIYGHKQSSFGNVDMTWSGTFYSDVKKLAGV